MISTITKTLNQQVNNGFGLLKLVLLGFFVCIVATACTESEQVSVPQSTTTQEKAGNEDKDTQKITTAPTPSVDATPVSYDVESWKSKKIKQLSVDDLHKMKKIFGKVVLTDKNSLDYGSNVAVRYRFMDGNDPYLDIIDSNEYLEYGWYYANPTDSDAEKKMSISHAKKVFKVAEGLMGQEGGEVVSKMLAGQIIKNKEVGGYKIELAKCEFYSCTLVIHKPV